jgi:hypothetical protein
MYSGFSIPIQFEKKLMGCCACKEERDRSNIEIGPYCVAQIVPMNFYHAQVQSIFPHGKSMVYVFANPAEEMTSRVNTRTIKANVFCVKPGVIEVFTENYPIDLFMIKKQIELFDRDGGGPGGEGSVVPKSN